MYSICLIFIFTLYELFLAFNCSNNTGSLVNSLFGVSILIPVPIFYLSNFTLLAIVSRGFLQFLFFSIVLSLKESRISLVCCESLFPNFFFVYHPHILYS